MSRVLCVFALLCPTLAPQAVEDFARRLAARGIQALDAPMSGGPARALDGTAPVRVMRRPASPA